MPTIYTCKELQYLMDQTDKELAELRAHRKQLMYQKRCFRYELERILRSHKN